MTLSHSTPPSAHCADHAREDLSPAERQRGLEAVASKIAGKRVVLEVRGPREFTFSCPGADASAAQRLADFFGQQPGVAVDTHIDPACGTSVYVCC